MALPRAKYHIAESKHPAVWCYSFALNSMALADLALFRIAKMPSLAGSTKRKASDTLHNESVKRRASRACLVCRNRKVRCDVVQNGVPCNNCRLDGVSCILTNSNRRKPKSISVDHEVQDRQIHSPQEVVESDQVGDIPVSLTFEGNASLPFALCSFAYSCAHSPWWIL